MNAHKIELLLFVLSIVLLLTSCSHNMENLEGDWVSLDEKYAFSLRQGKGSYLFPFYAFTDFYVNGDTIHFEGRRFKRGIELSTRRKDMLFLYSFSDISNNLELIDLSSLEKNKKMSLRKLDSIEGHEIDSFIFHGFNNHRLFREIYVEYDGKTNTVILLRCTLDQNNHWRYGSFVDLEFEEHQVDKNISLLKDTILHYVDFSSLPKKIGIHNEGVFSFLKLNISGVDYEFELRGMEDLPIQVNILIQYIYEFCYNLPNRLPTVTFDKISDKEFYKRTGRAN